MKKSSVLALILLTATLCLVLNASLIPCVKASSGEFFLGSTTMSEEIWSNPDPQQMSVTVSVTSAMGDAYADTSKMSVTVKTDNKEITLHNGDSQTMEDSTSSIWLYENAGYDHNFHNYYGIGGTWEITVIGGGGGHDLTGAEGDNWAIWAVVAIVIVGLSAAVVFLLIKRKPTKTNPQP